MKTISGVHVIFNIHQLSKELEQNIPNDFDLSEGEWFYQPSAWNKENRYGRLETYARFLKERADFPPIYSLGYKTKEEAFAGAEEWEKNPNYLGNFGEEEIVKLFAGK